MDAILSHTTHVLNSHFPPQSLADFDFCFQNISATDCNVLLENSGGQMWICSYLAATYCLAAGWLLFVEDNGLKQHDSLVFEAISPHHLKVNWMTVNDDIGYKSNQIKPGV